MASERADLRRDERTDFRVVRNRQGALEAVRLVGQVVAAGDRDELVRAARGLGPFPRDLQEVVPPEVHLLRFDRLKLHVHVPPALLFVFHSVSPPKFVGSDPPSVTEGRATELTDINLLDETDRGEMPTANGVTAALNSAFSSSARNGLLQLSCGIRRELLPPLWRHRGGVADLVRGPPPPRRLAMPPIRHIVQRELLPAIRS